MDHLDNLKGEKLLKIFGIKILSSFLSYVYFDCSFYNNFMDNFAVDHFNSFFNIASYHFGKEDTQF